MMISFLASPLWPRSSLLFIRIEGCENAMSVLIKFVNFYRHSSAAQLHSRMQSLFGSVRKGPVRVCEVSALLF